MKAIDHTFSWFTSFSRVLLISRVGYHAGKPIESVVYCLNKQYHGKELLCNLHLNGHT